LKSSRVLVEGGAVTLKDYRTRRYGVRKAQKGVSPSGGNPDKKRRNSRRQGDRSWGRLSFVSRADEEHPTGGVCFLVWVGSSETRGGKNGKKRLRGRTSARSHERGRGVSLKHQNGLISKIGRPSVLASKKKLTEIQETKLEKKKRAEKATLYPERTPKQP